MNNRRKLLVVFGAGLLVTSLTLFAQQQPAKIARIGFLGATSLASYGRNVDALRAGLRELGYVEGKNLVLEFRWAEGKYDRLPELAAELVRLKVDIIVTHGTPGVRAAKSATSTIPIVFAVVGDAVAAGLVTSLARPGGNTTGSAFFVPELNAKRLELIKEAVPRITRVGMLMNPNNQAAVSDIKLMEEAAKSMKVELQQFLARGPEDFESVISAMAKRRVQAVVIGEDPMLITNAGVATRLAAKHRIPSIGFIEIAEAGGLMAYGITFPPMYRRAAYFVDKILKGAKPGDLPVERATIFELVINLKSAKALGVKIPPTLLQRADKVIE